MFRWVGLHRPIYSWNLLLPGMLDEDTKVNEIEGSTLWEGRYIFFVGNYVEICFFFFELEYLSTTGENFTSFVKKSMRFHGRLENTSKEKIPEWKRGLKFVMQRFSLERFPFCRAMTREDRKLHAERRITLSIIRVVNRGWPHFWPHREILESTTSMTGVIGDRLTLGSLSFSRRTGARLSVELCIRPYRKSSCR